MEPTLEQRARARDNDYSALEAAYRRATGGELARDPWTSPRHPGPPLTLTASVVIPAWNARDTLERCLRAIEESSFNRAYPEQLEVVVVDDGSTDGTWELLERLSLGLRLKAVQQTHHSRAHTQNTGIAVAEGAVIISCDADMILAPLSIEELVRRHQACDHLMGLGFRSDVDPGDPRITPAALPATLPALLPPYAGDVRLTYRAGGWPESMCRDTDHLKRLGGGKAIYMADGARWDLPGMVYGALFSLRREDYAAMEGYDERFYGWGCEDTLVGVRALALGAYIVPVYAAAGLHIAHGDRSPRKWHEFAANRQVFSAILRAPFTPGDGRWAERARGRARRRLERAPAGGRPEGPYPCLGEAFDRALADPAARGKYLHGLGRYEEAAAAFAEVRGTPADETWAVFDRGKALRAAGHAEGAAALLEEAAARLPASPWPRIELALALAAGGRFAPARAALEQAAALEPANPALTFVLGRPAAKHLERAALYARQGDQALARRDYEAALILDPRNTAAQVERAAALAALGQARAAQAALAAHLAGPGGDDPRAAAARLELARLHLALGEPGAAKVALERARRRHPHDPEVAARLAEFQAATAAAHPLPRPAPIVAASAAIPGWFGADEAELLIALAWQAAAGGAAGGPPVLVEIGSYCGRATVALGLAVRALGRVDARIVAVNDPAVGLAPDGRPPRAVLREQLAAHALAGLVILAPEEDAAPWRRASHLLLIDGQHDYRSVRGDVERYVPRLAPGGLLLFHDYADYFPDVQTCVDELLVDPGFEFVAQAASLIALRRRAATPLPPGSRNGPLAAGPADAEAGP